MRTRLLQARWALTAVLVLGLLLALVGGALTAGDDEAEAAATITDRMVIPPGAFIANDDFDYYNDGFVMQTIGNGGTSRCFTAPIEFPVDMPTKKLNVNRVFMWAQDNTAGREISMGLYRTVPKNATEAQIGYVQTVDSPAFPQEASFRGYGAPVFRWNNGLYLFVCMDEGLFFYGAAINYSY